MLVYRPENIDSRELASHYDSRSWWCVFSSFSAEHATVCYHPRMSMWYAPSHV